MKKTMKDFATYAEFTQYRRDMEIAQQGKTVVTLSDGSTVEVVGKDFDMGELERAHDRELMREAHVAGPAPDNGLFFTDTVQF